LIYRQFIEVYDQGFRTLFMLELQHDSEMDWYEVRVFRGQELVGYVHGYANQGWNPQVNNIWVSEPFRRKGIGSLMMEKLEDYTGQSPIPATPIDDNPAARAFWSKHADEKDRVQRGKTKEAKYIEGAKKVQYRQFAQYRQKKFKTLLLVVFEYDRANDWFEIKVFSGPELIASAQGSGNEGWHPQVTQIWVEQTHRRRGIGIHMMEIVSRYFGHTPKPTFPLEDDPVAVSFWKKAGALKSHLNIRSSRSGLATRPGARFRQFVEMPKDNTAELLMVDFHFDPENDWFEISVNRGKQTVAGCEGHGNEGWRPQVHRIWVLEGFRRRGIATLMLSKLERHFGHKPAPTSNFEEDAPEAAFWKEYLGMDDSGAQAGQAV
jgi:ribosomal protein S18 acetylase RimI-like enzyme